MNVLDVQNLTLSFGESSLFSNISFDVKDGEKVGVVGVNGAGKTSLFKLITGEYIADNGACFISKNSDIGYMEQHTCSENRTIWDEIISVFKNLSDMEAELQTLVKEIEKTLPTTLLKDRILSQPFFSKTGDLHINQEVVLR